VWARTHRLGGRCWILAGALIAIAGFGGRLLIWVGIGGAAVAVLAPVVYSWWLWRNLPAA
jgi:hypothetical protein